MGNPAGTIVKHEFRATSMPQVNLVTYEALRELEKALDAESDLLSRAKHVHMSPLERTRVATMRRAAGERVARAVDGIKDAVRGGS